MSEILSVAESSLLTDLLRLDVISNNLANANTPGFRRDVPVSRSFGEQLADELGAAGVGSPELRAALLEERTTRVTDQHPGTLRFTGNPLDVAVEGDGFLTLEGANGPVYSRMGSLSLDPGGRLVGAGGLPVLGIDGEIQLSTSTPRIDAEGVIWEDEQPVGQLKLARFDAPDGLRKLGSGLFAGAEPQPPSDDRPLRVRQEHLESSNVSVMSEMVLLIGLMRRFETTQRLVQNWDESMAQAVRTIGDL